MNDSLQKFYQNRYKHLGGGMPGLETEATFECKIKNALKEIGPTPKRILDFGCNVGAAAKFFTDKGHQVTGVDISESAIERAKSYLPKAAFQQIGSENQLPFVSESFDVCFASEVIEHLFDVKGFVREIHRVLVKDGLLILTTPYHGWLKNILIVVLNFDRHFSPIGSHIRFFSKRSLVQLLQSNGFSVKKIKGLGRIRPVWKTMFVTALKHS